MRMMFEGIKSHFLKIKSCSLLICSGLMRCGLAQIGYGLTDYLEFQ